MRGVRIAGSGRAARIFHARLSAAGFAVDLVDPAAKGAGVAGCDDAGTLLLVPHDLAECEALLFETQALAKRTPAPATIVIAATLSPRYIRALRGRINASIALADAPFSGTQRAAQEGRLAFLLGGRPEDIERLQPLFDHLGHRSPRVGAFGAATAAKVMHDFLAASSNAMTRIALDWAEAQGIDEARLLDIVGDTVPAPSSAASDVLDAAVTCPGNDGCVGALVREIEIALDNALAGAHLTPPQALEDVFRGLKQRHLH